MWATSRVTTLTCTRATSSYSNLFAGFSQLVRQNTEQLGSGSVEVGGVKYLPQLRYWLLDYAKSPSQSARRSSIDRLNYVNTSPNARQLTQPQRAWLLEVLKLHDALASVDRPLEGDRQTERNVERPAPAETTAPVEKPFVPQPVITVLPVAVPVPPPQPPPIPQPAPQPDLSTVIDQKLDTLERRVAATERSTP